MTPVVRAIVHPILVTLALAWALAPYDSLPVVYLRLTSALIAVLALLLVHTLCTSRAIRLPFHIQWPVVVVGILIAVCTYTESIPHPTQAATALVVFVAVIQFADSQAHIRRLLLCLVVGGAIASVLPLIDALFPLVPTVLSVDGPTLPIGGSFANGLLIPAFTSVGGLTFARTPELNRNVRGAMGLSALLALACAAIIARPAANGLLPELSSSPHTSISAILLGLATLWLAARVAAKVTVQRRLAKDEWQGPVLHLLTTVFVFSLADPLSAGLLLPLLGGLACAMTLPHHEAQSPPARDLLTTPVLAILAILVAFNATHVALDNRSDPRNYDAALAANLDNPDPDLWRMYARRYPNEPRMYLWHARRALGAGNTLACAEAIRRAGMYVADIPLLPPPTHDELDDLVIRLRDHVQTIDSGPEQFAYERALIATGEEDAAFYVLTERLRPGTGESPPSGWRNLADELLQNGNARPYGQYFESWDRDSLLRYFEAWGIKTPGSPGPDWLLAQWRGDGLHVVRHADGATSLATATPKVFGVEGRNPIAWQSVREDSGGAVRWNLLELDDNGAPIATLVSVNEDGNFDWSVENAVNPGWRPAVLFVSP